MSETDIEIEAMTDSCPKPSINGFWGWLFFSDSQGDRGFYNLIDVWNVIGLVLCSLFAIFIKIDAVDVTSKIALPAAAVVVGLSFAWAGRSASLLHDKEFSRFILKHGPDVDGYIYSFQLAILTVFILIAVSIGISSGVVLCTTGDARLDDILNKFAVSFAGWIAVRESWGAISFANKLSLQLFEVRRREVAEDDWS